MFKIFVARVSAFNTVEDLPKWVQNLISQTTDAGLKAQRTAAYGLLDFALKSEFGVGLKANNAKKNSSGKPICDGAFISLSHSDGAVCAALSDGIIGVDMENLARQAYSPALAARTLTESELELLTATDERDKNALFLKLWTAKESIYKRDGGTFSPRNISGANAKSFELTLGDSRFILSSAGAEEPEIIVYE